MTNAFRWWWISLFLATVHVMMAAPPGEPGGPGEYRDFRVIKSYFAREGDYTFRAFVIEWEGQEVVAKDPGSLIKARSDDTINVLISRGLPGQHHPLGLILFLARPEKKPPGGYVVPSPPETRAPAQLEVKKVYALKDSDHAFRAYEVDWKGSDVIVFDAVPATTYKAGDTVPVLVTKHLYEYRGETRGVLNFILTPPRANRSKSR